MKTLKKVQSFTPLSLISIIMITVLAACSNENDESNPYIGFKLDSRSTATAEQLKHNTIDYLKYTADYFDNEKSNSNGNFMISPFSANMCLSMIANGLDEDKQNLVASFLGIDNIENVNTLSKEILAQMPGLDKKSSVNIYNAFWYNNNYTINDAFASTLSQFYNADFKSVAMDNPSTLTELNKLVAKKTGNKIPQALDKLSDNTIFVDLSTLCFDSKWSSNFFKPENTYLEPFYGNNGKSNVKMMHGSFNTSYNFDDDFDYLEIKFGNGTYKLIVLLPKENIDITEAFKSLDYTHFDQLQKTAVECIITLSLPRFEINSSLKLDKILEKSTVTGLFSNFSDMFTSPVSGYFSMDQKSFFSINEDGVEIKVETKGELLDTAAPLPGKPYTVVVNRPFFFFIENNSVCLAAGRVMNL